MSIQAPPQWASTSRKNGFSYLSWKRKTLLAATVILCGGGLAAQFPSIATFEEPVACAQTDFEGTIPSLSQPQNRYANNAQTMEEDDGPSLARPGEPFRRYVEPPKMDEEDESEDSPPTPQSVALRKAFKFDVIDDSDLEKKTLDLPLARWNPRFDQPPPLSGRISQVQIDNRELVPAQEDEITVMILADSIVPAAEEQFSSEAIPMISLDQLRPGSEE